MSDNPYEAPQSELGPSQPSPLAAIPKVFKVLILLIMIGLEIYWGAHVLAKLFEILDLPPPTWLTAKKDDFHGGMVLLFLVNGWLLSWVRTWK